MGAHRTLDDIAAASNVKRKEVSRDFRILHSRLELKIPQQDPMKCIQFFDEYMWAKYSS